MTENTRKRSSSELGFIHKFIPASTRQDQVTLLLLHGTGGNEQDLIPLGREPYPRAAMLSPRGKVLLPTKKGSTKYNRITHIRKGIIYDIKHEVTNEVLSFMD